MRVTPARRSLLFALARRLSLAFVFGALISLLGGLWQSSLSYAVLADALLLRFLLDRREWATKSFWDQAPCLLFLPLYAIVATYNLNFGLNKTLGLTAPCFSIALIAAMIFWAKTPLPRAFPLSPAYGLAAASGALVMFQIVFHFRALDSGIVLLALLLAVIGSLLGGLLHVFAAFIRTLPRHYIWKYHFWKYYSWVRSVRGVATPALEKPTREEPPPPARSTLSRRTVLAGLVGAGGLLATGAGVAWLTRYVAPHSLALVTYKGHEDGVFILAWSPDGSRIATAGGDIDKTIQIWEATSGKTLLTYRGHADGLLISSLAWSPDGRQIASADFKENLHIWDTATGGHMVTYTKRGFIAQWSPDGRRIASSDFHSIQIRDALTDTLLLTYQPQQFAPCALAWSPGGTRIVAGSSAGDEFPPGVHVFNAVTGETIALYNSHISSVRTAIWSPDGKRIASASIDLVIDTPPNQIVQKDPTVHIWDASTGKQFFRYRGHTDTVNGAAWSPDGRRIASASDDETVQVWDADTGSHVFTYHNSFLPDIHPSQVAWSPDGRLIASASYDFGGDAQVWVPEKT
ncbi:MAG TPA: WD40 repeat domain-containing protein [Ktedonobacterales bacterium]|jgi:Tol biopolymer transport system component